jgi:hypothetical protein
MSVPVTLRRNFGEAQLRGWRERQRRPAGATASGTCLDL